MEKREGDKVVTTSKKLDPNAPAFKPGAGLHLAHPHIPESACLGTFHGSSRALRIIGIPLEFSYGGTIRDQRLELQRELSAWGSIRAMQFYPCGGTATVYYYDLRSAMAALTAMQQQHLAHQRRMAAKLWQIDDRHSSSENSDRSGLIAGCVVWAQYTITTGLETSDNRLNQGTLIIFNIDASTPNTIIWSFFEKYGSVREVRNGSPSRKNKFVEFFDIRDAASALKAMNGREIAGRRISVAFSHRSNTFPRKKASPPLSPSSPLSLINSYGEEHHNFNVDGRVCMADNNTPQQRRGAMNEASCNSSSLIEPVNDVERWDSAVSSDQLMDEYMFNETEAELEDGRTTLMVRNIPNKYSQENLLALLDKHCAGVNAELENSPALFSAYDFVYLPVDFKNKCNLGYAFVNFTTPGATTKFHKEFDGRKWGEFHSRKICKVSYARVQGRKSLEDHFRNSPLACDTKEFLPRVFISPRNGIDGELQEVSGRTS